ncbi:cytochrome P450 [Hygrophoropsis aurantiaca]|uniref:Cytochrome P450 n=1 Tax=Hygrophoropsis aurantiaca TaxID=72124 RepID=A0ACB8AJ97_9AGAM|nr:cytochrome P450 [Hygrophoropsis aurantiaca]
MAFRLSTISLAGLVLIPSFAFIIRNLVNRKRTHLPLPPGPTPVPLLGNILSIKADEPWVTYTQWKAAYGDIVYSRALGQEIIIINSEDVARALMEKRSHNYSDRPRLATILPFGWGYNTGFQPYADRWRLHRRCLHQAFRADSVSHYRPMQLRKARQLCLSIFETANSSEGNVLGEELVLHVQTFAASIIMSATYDYETLPHNDPLVHIVERALDLAIKFMTPEKAAILGFLPILLHLPDWFPGSVKSESKLSQKYSDDMVEVPFQHAMKSIREGTAGRCMISETKVDEELEPDSRNVLEKALKDSSATAFVAGAETTASTILVFILMMVLNPRVQKKAQAELDSVIGNGRLPDYSDRPSLAYIDAILRETLRWFPVVPLGMPHTATAADVYEEYHIPKGAILVPNAWGMSRDETKYPDASEFKPERFFNGEGELNDDTVVYSFGFGRRVCPGRYLADASLWTAIVSLLAIFKFSKCKDEAGNDMEVVPQWTTGLTSYPRFPCCIAPRMSGLDKEALVSLIHTSGSGV